MDQLKSISYQVWDMKYRLKKPDGKVVDRSIKDTWKRVAKALASIEKDKHHWEKKFFKILEDFQFLPAGRVLSGAGSNREVTLFNCFVMGDIPDNLSGIFDSLKEAALTMQQGGGIGYDFSSLRPEGAEVKGVGADASGPLSFMDVWDSMCRTIMSAGSRRGAMMGVMRCDHPDVLKFVEAKSKPGRLRMFNLSVLISDSFMNAVRNDELWDLKFENKVFSTHPAREIWEKIMQATYSYAEPGVIFIDRINKKNNLYYCEDIHGTNPCGEQPLPPYGACLLGSVNLVKFIKMPFEENASLDRVAFTEVINSAVRMLDNVIDISRFPLKAQRDEALSKRRIGLGITGLADALIMCNAAYGDKKAVRLTNEWMGIFQSAAYDASIQLAKEKGVFPKFVRTKYLKGETIKNLDKNIWLKIKKHGIRNSLITSVAPTGTISLLAENVSSGIEPVFSFQYSRKVLMPDGSHSEQNISDYAFRYFKKLKGDDVPMTASFVDTQVLKPSDHLIMQSVVQKYIDSSISKTINVPEAILYEDFKNVYMQSYELDCKGCTTFRPNEVTGSVLTLNTQDQKNDAVTNSNHVSQEEHAEMVADNTHDVVQMFEPLDRPENLVGKTYKIKWPESDHAIYITINDIQDSINRKRPFEIFINSKNMEHFSWTVALTRMISAVFRRGGDVSFVVEELKAVFDPRGGQWMRGRYIPSLLAAIGEVIEIHMIDIGFLPKSQQEESTSLYKKNDEPELQSMVSRMDPVISNKNQPKIIFKQCPKCSQASIVRQEGCDICISCSYAKCG